jgi:hypothetical protein
VQNKIVHTQNPKKDKGKSDEASQPPMQNVMFYLDIYEIFGLNTDARVELIFMGERRITEWAPIKEELKCNRWSNDAGRITEFKITVP